MASAISARGAQVIVWSYVTWAIAAFFVILRLIVRWKVVHVIGREDACVFVALVFSLLCSVFMGLQVSVGGLGQHFNELTVTQITEFLRFAYFAIIFYNLSLSLTKFGILLLCMRVFGPSKWRRACYVVFVIISAYTLWAFVTAIVPCNPIPKYWYPAKDGWCFPKAILWFLNAGLNIFTDFLIVILPIPAILALQLPRKQKIGVSLVFTLGFFICIISIVRLRALYVGATTTDPTYDNFSIAIWSVVEVNGAIIGACLPTLRPLIARLWPRLLSSGHSRHPNTNTYYRHGTGADGTMNTKRETKIRGIMSVDGDDGSAAEILGDGVVLSDIERKSGVIHTQSQECDADSRNDTVTIAERRVSMNSWSGSGRSDEVPVYQAREAVVGKAH